MPTYYGTHKVLPSKWNYPPNFANNNQIDLSVPVENYFGKAFSDNWFDQQSRLQENNLHDTSNNVKQQQSMNTKLEANQSQLTKSIDAAIYQMENTAHDNLNLHKNIPNHSEMETFGAKDQYYSDNFNTSNNNFVNESTLSPKLKSTNQAEAVKLNETMQNEINSIMNNVEQYIKAIKLTEHNGQVAQIENKNLETQQLGL